MRILHTSDWHLGIRHGPISRGPDHDLFLRWLETTLAEQQVDALVVAGDVFDAMHPPAEALRRYYQFLARVADTGVAQVLIVGGNHDSASRLDAPAEVLSALQVHVVGGLDDLARCVVPLRDRQGQVRAVALAVPYVHEFRLGVRTTQADAAEVRARFRERFAALYADLADRAQALHPGLPLLATGHLTLGLGATREDYPHAIHQVGNLDGLPADLLDPRIQYTALGHIHRSYPADPARRAWYSGSPIALSLPEAATPRRVLRVDLHPEPDGAPTVHPIEVPTFRDLVELSGSAEAVLEAVPKLRWTAPLAPLLFARVVADTLPATVPHQLRDALDALPEDRRPLLVHLRHELPASAAAPELPEAVALGDLTPLDVFRRRRGDREPEAAQALDEAFASLLSATDDDFTAQLDQARGTP